MIAAMTFDLYEGNKADLNVLFIIMNILPVTSTLATLWLLYLNIYLRRAIKQSWQGLIRFMTKHYVILELYKL